MDSFIEKFGGSISSTLECFDRVIFKGHLPFQNEARLNGFVDHVLKIRRNVIRRAKTGHASAPKTGHHVGGIGRKNPLVGTCWQGA